MRMKTASTLLLAAAFVRGASCQSSTEDRDTQAVGIIRTNDTMRELLDFGFHATVVSSGEVVELMCDTFVEAEDAETLTFSTLEGENIVAAKSYYAVTNGTAFTDGIGRKIWTGIVTDPAQGEDEALPRTVSMVWGDVCDSETFLLKITTWNVDGTTSIVKTFPCLVSNTSTCMARVVIDFVESGEAVTPPSSSSSIETPSSSDDTNTTSSPSPYARRLQHDGDTVIDVMVLYSDAALDSRGGVSASQMETNIIESIARTNEAFVNSMVSLYFNAVHIGPLPYDQEFTDTEESMRKLTYDLDVQSLRDSTGADLVQMVGDYNDGNCGRAYLYEGGGAFFATSVVAAFCLDDNTVAHEFGHNLGCLHNREDASYPTPYAHGIRYCSGDDPYRTIMSYWCGSTYVNYFSNPDVSFLDKPTGTDTENNAQIIRDNMVDVSNFKSRVESTPTPAPVFEPEPTPAPVSEPDSDEYDYIGCFRDDTGNRVLSGQFIKGDSGMTIEVCAEFCKGSPYFGTEYGQECFCGRAADDPEEWDSSSSCTFECAGDVSQTCGGPNAISVYENEEVDAPPPPPEGYLGCWQDSSPNRAMEVMESDPSMTNDLCAEICSSYPIYGTQYGQECWCDSDSTGYTANGESNSCTIACAGDESQECGGFFALSVYEHEAEASPPPPPPPSGFLGCWTDTASDRVMDDSHTDSSMTNDLCKDICSSSAFYATQYGEECWCGDESTDYDTHGESNSCNMACAGDADDVCGGVYAMSVWEQP